MSSLGLLGKGWLISYRLATVWRANQHSHYFGLIREFPNEPGLLSNSVVDKRVLWGGDGSGAAQLRLHHAERGPWRERM